MKLIIAAGFFASTANGALSTMRVGPKNSIRGDVGFEFGRPVNVVDADAAFQEMQLIQRRFLHGGASYINDAGASFPHPGMSLPYPGMSIPYPGMSIPYSGMSLPYYPGMYTPPPSMAPADSTTDLQQPDSKASSATCVGRDLTASTQIHIQLDVDSSSVGTSFLDDLAQSIVSYGEFHFLLCHNAGDERLLSVLTSTREQDRNNATVTGLDATASTGNTNEVCTPAEEGSYCTVVDVVLTVYSPTEDLLSAAEQQVYDEVLVKQLDAGTFVNGDIIAIRFHAKETHPTDSSAVSRDGNQQQAPTGGADDSSTVRTIVISVLVLVAVAVLVGLVIRKRMANQQGSGDAGSEDDSKSYSSSSIAGDGAVSDSLQAVTSDSLNVV